MLYNSYRLVSEKMPEDTETVPERAGNYHNLALTKNIAVFFEKLLIIEALIVHF